MGAQTISHREMTFRVAKAGWPRADREMSCVRFEIDPSNGANMGGAFAGRAFLSVENTHHRLRGMHGRYRENTPQLKPHLHSGVDGQAHKLGRSSNDEGRKLPPHEPRVSLGGEVNFADGEGVSTGAAHVPKTWFEQTQTSSPAANTAMDIGVGAASAAKMLT